MRNELANILAKNSLEFRSVTLASGKTSDFYLDSKKTSLHPRGLFLISLLFFHELQKGNWPKAVGGPTLGADPLTAGLIFLSQIQEKPLMGFIIRKQPKNHGTSVWMEGAENITPGSEVVLLEDVVTTAGSSISAIEKIRAAGFHVHRLLCIVDREEGGRAALEKNKVQMHSLFIAADLKKIKS
jgi:orotate phosphoribosyltransferase